MKCIWMECLSTALHYLLIQALLFCVSIFSYEGRNFSIKNASRDSDGDASKSSLCIGLQCGNNN